MVQMAFGVHCTEGWNGTACEMLCSGSGCNIRMSLKDFQRNFLKNLVPIFTVKPPTTNDPDEISATTDSEPRVTLPPAITEGLVVDNANSDVVGIAVGVSVGVVVFILLVVLITIVIIVATKRKLTWRRTFKPESRPSPLQIQAIMLTTCITYCYLAPSTVSYKLKKPLRKEDIQPIPSLEPLNGTHDVYATVNKSKRKGLSQSQS